MKKTKKKRGVPKKGEQLLNQVIRMTGMPSRAIKNELKSILERKNIDVRHLTLDQLREVVAAYVREIMGGLLDRNKSDDTRH